MWQVGHVCCCQTLLLDSLAKIRTKCSILTITSETKYNIKFTYVITYRQKQVHTYLSTRYTLSHEKNLTTVNRPNVPGSHALFTMLKAAKSVALEFGYIYWKWRHQIQREFRYLVHIIILIDKNYHVVIWVSQIKAS